MKQTDLNEINVFINVIEAGSFTKASQKLEMPTSTVSAKIASLEQRLGTRLIQRTTRQLKLTQSGEDFFNKVNKGVGIILSAENELSQDNEEPQGVLRITAPNFIGALLLPHILIEMNKSYPKVKFDIILSDSSLDMINEGIDLAIRAGDLKDSSLISKKLGDAHFIALASPRYLKENPILEHPKDLINHKGVLFSHIIEDDWQMISGRQKQKMAFKDYIKVNDLNLCQTLVSKGMGIGLMPHSILNTESRKDLIQVLPEWRLETRSLSLIYPSQKFLAPKTRAFINIATEYIGKCLR